MDLPWESPLPGSLYAMALGVNLIAQDQQMAWPTADLLASWLRVGPVWTAGIAVDCAGNVAGPGHVVVIAGIRAVQNSNEYEIYVYDPWPPSIGPEGWRPISHLNTIEMAAINPFVDTTFLSY
jgi:hypothetical protein